MIEKMKSFIRKHKLLYRILAGTYRNTIYLVKCGYVKSMIGYLLKTAGPEKKKLRAMGYTKPKAFKSKTWRIGKGLDGAQRRYYTAYKDGKKVFIKVAKFDATIRNEIELAQYLQDYSLDFVCPVVQYEKNFAPDTMMLANAYLDGVSSLKLPENAQDFAGLCDQFLHILQQLDHCGVIHADVHKNNLMLIDEKCLVLFDFGISMIKGQKNSIDYVARPGTFYTMPEQGRRVYDDAYSFVMQMQKLGLPEAWQSIPQYQAIKNAIGHNVGVVDLQ